MEVLVVLVAMTLVVGALVVFGLLRRSRNQWDQTDAMRALRRVAAGPDEAGSRKDDAGSASQ
jgi:hypothetical protein